MMNCLRTLPMRKVKSVLMVAILLGLVKLLWVSFYSESSSDTLVRLPIDNRKRDTGSQVNVVNMMHNIAGQLLQGPKVFDQCTDVEAFRKYSPKTISTFDLLNETDYSMDSNQRYKIPGPFTESRDPAVGPTQVIVVPFSHADPGYGNTVEGYYQSMTKHVLDNMLGKLSQYPNMTFQWAETVFLERWFQDITDQQKQQVRGLIQKGQLEIVLGSWVMPDEAVTHYVPVVDQLVEGHQWVLENLGITPTNAWINDPFGYSSTMPYLWKSSGVDNMVILRIHQAVKGTLMKKRALDFRWRPLWEKDDQEDILCNLMPYPGYWNSDVCSPNQEVCKKFNYLHMQDRQSSGVLVTDQNVASLAKEFYEAYKYTSSLYKYNTLVMFIGEDNSYTMGSAWDDTYYNYQKLMDYVNKKAEWNMNIKFGTVREYFSLTRQNEIKMKQSGKSTSPSFPVLSGDFFPYSDWADGYWTGFYTTRPWLKKFSREIGPIIHAGDIYSVILHNVCMVSKQCNDVSQALKDIASDLRAARRELGIFQHHDGITGTCLPFVVNDYQVRLQNAYTHAKRALRRSIVALLSKGKNVDSEMIEEAQEKGNPREITKEKVLTIGPNGKRVVIANPQEKSRKEVVRLTVSEKHIKITSDTTESLPYQVSLPSIRKGVYEISFMLDMGPFQVKTVKIEVDKQANVVEARQETISLPLDPNHPNLTIENDNLKVIFNAKTGFIETIVGADGKETKMSLDFYKYDSIKSGAYLFAANGPAQPQAELRQVSKLVLTKGALMSEAVFTHGSGFTHTVRLYNVKSIQGHCVYINNEILAAHTNADFIMRFDTDINNGGLFFTDQNGFQLIGRRTFPERLIESNYYPITSMTVLEDNVKRLTLHVEQPHGAASLQNGQIEIMYDRNNNYDDQKGLGMGANEMVLTLSEFVVQIEYKSEMKGVIEERFTQPTINSIAVNEQFQNKLQIFSLRDNSKLEFKEPVQPLDREKAFPCDTAIVVLRNLLTNDFKHNGTSLVLHRKPYNCLYPSVELQCDVTVGSVTSHQLSFGGKETQTRVIETSLSHLHERNNVKTEDDLRPEPYKLRSFLIRN